VPMEGPEAIRLPASRRANSVAERLVRIGGLASVRKERYARAPLHSNSIQRRAASSAVKFVASRFACPRSGPTHGSSRFNMNLRAQPRMG
jgi:hypothetical protein